MRTHKLAFPDPWTKPPQRDSPPRKKESAELRLVPQVPNLKAELRMVRQVLKLKDQAELLWKRQVSKAREKAEKGKHVERFTYTLNKMDNLIKHIALELERKLTTLDS
jgi:hypothetical protein